MKKSLIVGVLLLGFLLAGCASEKGTLVMQITDAPATLNISKALVTISEVKVHIGENNETGNDTNSSGWMTVMQGSKTYDLVAIKDVKDILGSTELEAGRYTQVRLSVEKAVATIDGTDYNMTIPSKEVKLVKGFTIKPNTTTYVTLDFDAEESIHANGKNNYIMRPTIKLSEDKCYHTVSTSSEAPDHQHLWCEGDAQTGKYCNAEGKCHRHKINETANLAEAAGVGPHTHQLK